MCSPSSWMESTPDHYPMLVDVNGDWAVYPNPNEAVGVQCWCGSPNCPEIPREASPGRPKPEARSVDTGGSVDGRDDPSATNAF